LGWWLTVLTAAAASGATSFPAPRQMRSQPSDLPVTEAGTGVDQRQVDQQRQQPIAQHIRERLPDGPKGRDAPVDRPGLVDGMQFSLERRQRNPVG